ncbi:hypothetical protein [Flavobacterium soli]|uniref:hypothetical protein n=1 Tax=Flavobacterium soli TaxID=344881 RepID=UPI0012FC06C2|nr:hypothetical protein [Flavobacterium soli]
MKFIIADVKIMNNSMIREKRNTDIKGITVVEMPLQILSPKKRKIKIAITFKVAENENLDTF